MKIKKILTLLLLSGSLVLPACSSGFSNVDNNNNDNDTTQNDDTNKNNDTSSDDSSNNNNNTGNNSNTSGGSPNTGTGGSPTGGSGNGNSGNTTHKTLIERIVDNTFSLDNYTLTVTGTSPGSVNIDGGVSEVTFTGTTVSKHKCEYSNKNSRYYANESSTNTKASYSEFKEAFGVDDSAFSNQQFMSEMQDRMAWYGLSNYEIDEANDEIILTGGSQNSGESCYCYSEEGKQYYFYVKTSDSSIAYFSYLLDSSLNNNQVTPLGDLAYMRDYLNKLTYDSLANAYTAEELDVNINGTSLKIKDVSIKVSNDLISELAATLDYGNERIYNYVYEWSKVGTTSFNVYSESTFANWMCQKHGEGKYDHLPGGHRKYCNSCNKYLGELEQHELIEEHNFCRVCGTVTDLERQYLDVSKVKDSNGNDIPVVIADYSPKNKKYYNFSFNYQNSLYSGTRGTKYYEIKSLTNPKVLIVKTDDLENNGQYLANNTCWKAYPETVDLYYYDSIEYQESYPYYSSYIPYTFNDVDFDTFIANPNNRPFLSLTGYYFKENHGQTNKLDPVIDGCASTIAIECERCHEIVDQTTTYNHTSLVYSQVSHSEFSQHVDENWGSSNDVYFKGVCQDCEMIEYYKYTRYDWQEEHITHATSGYSGEVYKGSQKGLDIVYWDTLPHIEGNNHKCIFCGATMKTIGNFSFVYYSFEGDNDIDYHGLSLDYITKGNFKEVSSNTVNYITYSTYDYVDANQKALARFDFEIDNNHNGALIAFTITVPNNQPFRVEFDGDLGPENNPQGGEGQGGEEQGGEQGQENTPVLSDFSMRIGNQNIPLYVDSTAENTGAFTDRKLALIGTASNLKSGDQFVIYYKGQIYNYVIGADDNPDTDLYNNFVYESNAHTYPFYIQSDTDDEVTIWVNLWEENNVGEEWINFFIQGGTSTTHIVQQQQNEDPAENWPTDGYGIVINETIAVGAARMNETDIQGRTQYKITAQHFTAGQTFTLHDFGKDANWVIAIDGYSFGGNTGNYVSKGNSVYTVLQDFTADIYLKMKYQDDQIYFQLV